MRKASRAAAKVAEMVKEQRQGRIILHRKIVEFVPAALKDLKAMGKEVTSEIGMQLELLSLGESPTSIKPVPQIGPGTHEIRTQTAAHWIRVFYVATFEDAIWVVDAIEKKQGRIEQVDIERARARYREASERSTASVARMKAAQKGKRT